MMRLGFVGFIGLLVRRACRLYKAMGSAAQCRIRVWAFRARGLRVQGLVGFCEFMALGLSAD